MAFTATDLIAVEAAILKLQLGERVASVTYDGKTVSYSAVQMDDLLKLRDKMKAEIPPSSGGARKRQLRGTTSKGL